MYINPNERATFIQRNVNNRINGQVVEVAVSIVVKNYTERKIYSEEKERN